VIKDIDDPLIEAYLCDELSEPDREAFEARYFTDATADQLDALAAAEDELLCRLARGEIAEPRYSRVVARYSRTPAERERLELARAMVELASARKTAVPVVATAPAVSVWQRWLAPKRLGPVLALASLALVVSISGVWRADDSDPNRVAAALTLDPGVTRADPAARVDLRADAGVVQIDLRLLTDVSSYARLQAALVAAGQTRESWNGDAVRDGALARVRIPVRELPRGDYVLHLRGVDSAGRAGDIDSFMFSVAR
jgi:hypothetical protein